MLVVCLCVCERETFVHALGLILGSMPEFQIANKQGQQQVTTAEDIADIFTMCLTALTTKQVSKQKLMQQRRLYVVCVVFKY